MDQESPLSVSSSASWPTTLNPKGPIKYMYECAFCCTDIPAEQERGWPVPVHSVLMKQHYELPMFAKSCFFKYRLAKDQAKARGDVSVDTLASGQLIRKMACKICKPAKCLSSPQQTLDHLDIIHDYQTTSEETQRGNKRVIELEVQNAKLKRQNSDLIVKNNDSAGKCQELQDKLFAARNALAAEKQKEQEKTHEFNAQKEKVRQLENEICIVDQNSACKICLVERANMTFLPCYHLACCEYCGRNENVQTCPICRAIIRKKLPLFLS